MRKALCHWFRITADEERELWSGGIFSFDASVLLNIYAYSTETRNELVRLIENNCKRVRLPHQFALEYARNRSRVIIKQVHNYLKAERVLGDFQRNIESKRDHPYLGERALDALKEIQADLSEKRKEIEGLIGSDPYADKVLAIFNGRLGPAPSQEELARLHEQAEKRYKEKLPPGYSDLSEKGVPDAYGDFVGWSQLINIAISENTGVVLVIDDQKEDWWLMERDRTIGPRPELIEEFSSRTKQKLWIYTSGNFLRAAKIYAAAEIEDKIIEEVTQRLASQKESERAADLKPGLAEASLEKSSGGPPDDNEPIENDPSLKKPAFVDTEKAEANT